MQFYKLSRLEINTKNKNTTVLKFYKLCILIIFLKKYSKLVIEFVTF